MQLRSTHTLHTKHATNKQTIFIWTSEPTPLQDVLVTCSISSYFDRRAWGSLVEKAINGELEELEEPGLRLLHLRCVLHVLPAHLVGMCPHIHQLYIYWKSPQCIGAPPVMYSPNILIPTTVMLIINIIIIYHDDDDDDAQSCRMSRIPRIYPCKKVAKCGKIG